MADDDNDREEVLKKKKKKKRKYRGEREERSADPDPVTEAGDGTTKSNPPSKIESRRGSVYLMKEKRRHRGDPTVAEDQEGRPRRKTK